MHELSKKQLLYEPTTIPIFASTTAAAAAKVRGP
jgi:hypothetical protein